MSITRQLLVGIFTLGYATLSPHLAGAQGPHDALYPANGAVDVPLETVLSWPPGKFAVGYDVYLGTAWVDVNEATRGNPRGVLFSQGQTTTESLAAGLAYGKTYYWRVDQVNATPDVSILKGQIWSFTTEPYAYPVKPTGVIASSAQANMGPEKTIDGSGLDANDLHGTEATAMWRSTGVQPNWIQYQFDKVYKLYELQVWNSNGVDESLVGFGARTVTIAYCADGITWRTLDNVPEFVQAPGTATHAANTTVRFGGVMAKYVRLTIHSTWGGLGITGLSEVRFSHIPVQAFAPQPANGAQDVSLETSLRWRSGREGGVHKVFFGTSQAAVTSGTAPAQTVTEPPFVLSNLNFGTTYYWRVDEVNAVTYAGDVWRFTTQEYAIIDDFESYNDIDHRIYDTWIDGRTDGKSGSTVGHMAAPFAEQTIVDTGRQAMPLQYDNTKPPYYSEASRTFDTPQNWTIHGATTLRVWYRGYDIGLVDTGGSSFIVRSDGSNIGGISDQFHFVCKQLDGDGSITVRVDAISSISVRGGGKAGTMIRETLDVGSRNVCFALTGDSGTSFQWRDTSNGTTASSQTAGLKPPCWVRITRTGNVFRAERSPDGKIWTPQGTDVTVAMAASVYIGMAVTTLDVRTTTAAYISNVATTGTVVGAWQSQPIGLTMRANDPARIYLGAEDAAGKREMLGGYDLDGTVTGSWRTLPISLTDLRSASVDVSAVKKLTIRVGDKANPKPGGTGMLYIDDISFGNSKGGVRSGR